MEENKQNHTFNLFYGLRDGELKHISEVENGLKCKCKCPACEKKLIARNGGTKRIHHFAHYESAECKYGVQSSIHIAAKQILENVKRIKVPGISTFIYRELEAASNHFISHGEFQEIFPETDIEIEEVILEKKLHRFIPDVIILSKGKRMIVEIAVTHFVGRQKLQKIISSRISAIEIDLSKIENDFNLNELKPLIVENLENKNWLYNQRETEEVERRKLKARKEITEKNKGKYDREIWYTGYYKDVTRRRNAENLVFKQVEDCPLKKREFKGKFYANVNQDCRECKHSRWLRENDRYLVCLHDYDITRPKHD